MSSMRRTQDRALHYRRTRYKPGFGVCRCRVCREANMVAEEEQRVSGTAPPAMGEPVPGCEYVNPERVFAELWEERCRQSPGVNYGHGLVQDLMVVHRPTALQNPPVAAPAPRRPHIDPLTGRVAVFALRDVWSGNRLVHVRGTRQVLAPSIAAEVVTGSSDYGYWHPDDPVPAAPATSATAATPTQDAPSTPPTSQPWAQMLATPPRPEPASPPPRESVVSLGIFNDLEQEDDI